jgi:GMP synthase-like glutamine amidotransferase
MDVVEQALEGSGDAGGHTVLMRLAVLQHVSFEGPAAIADWAISRGTPVSIVRLYEGEALPELSAFDMLAVMGGPMSVNDEAQYSWLGPELTLLRDAIGAGKAVLGVCLGAQLLAKTLGAKVYPARQKEIGWFPIERTGAQHALFDGIPASFTALHWHGETFDFPDGAIRLAQTAAVPNQAFAAGSRVLGLQFHMEATPESIKDLLEHAGDEIGNGPFEQAPGAIRTGTGHCESLRPLLVRMLGNLTRAAAGGT